MQTEKTKLSKLELHFQSGTIKRFTAILQGGVCVNTSYGELLGLFLKRLPGFTSSYITQHIQTIFLNGHPIDDLETPLVKENSVLALSAAMPGLAGAIFRRNSMHAALRSGSQPVGQDGSKSDCISIILKLFNVIGTERGPDLLRHGVFIPRKTIQKYFMERPSLQAEIHTLFTSDTILEKEDLPAFLERQDKIFLIVKETDARTTETS